MTSKKVTGNERFPTVSRALSGIAVAIFVVMAIASGAALAAGDPPRAADPGARAAVCGGCHGADGNSVVPNFPKLAGQQKQYLTKQLVDFKSGARKDAMMAGMVAGLSEADIVALTDWYASRPLNLGLLEPAPSPAGELLYTKGNPSRGIAPCGACHGMSGLGYPGFMPGGVPAVAGQHAAYTSKQLRAFRAGGRGNDKNGMMRQVASKLSEEDIDAVAAYIAGMRP